MTAGTRVAPRRRPPPLGHAEFAPRLLAWFVDVAGISILLGVLSGQILGPGLYYLVSNDLGSQTDSPIVFVWRILAIGVLELALTIAFEVFFLRALRATPGQRLIGLLTVTSESGLGLPLSRATGRALLLFGPFVAILAVPPNLGSQLNVFYTEGEFAWVSALPWVVRIAALAWYVVLGLTARAQDGRAFHDLASRSVVVRRAA